MPRHESAVVVDAHNDLLGLVARRPCAEQAHYFRSHWLPQLRSGGVDVQVLPVYAATDDLRDVLLMLESAHRVAAGNREHVALCYTGADMDGALADGKIALVLALEGCGAIGTEIGMLETMFRLGVRVVSFTHMGRTALADGSGEDATRSRLTQAGVEALTVLEELGMLMDVSHLSASGLDDVLERATRPLVASHSSAFALCQHHRNLTDERLKAIAMSGGVVGVNFIGPFVDPVAPTVERVVDHILHIGSIMGMDHVGLGPDFIEDYAKEIMPSLLDSVTPGLAGPTSLPAVTEALMARGVADTDMRAILGQSWLRVLREVMGVPGSR